MTRTLHTLFILLIAIGMRAATTDFVFKNISLQGETTVYNMAQDSLGIVWIGTENGLYSYDGYRSHAHFVQGERENTRIHTLHIQGNKIYIGAEAGLLCFDIRCNTYTDLHAAPRVIRAIAASDGGLWIGGADGLYAFSPKDGTMKKVNSTLTNIYSLLPTQRGLLVGTVSGLYLYGTFTRQISVRNGRQPLVNALASAKDGGVWVGTEGTLYHYDFTSMRPIQGIPDNSFKSFASIGNTLFAGTDNGLYIMDGSHTAHIVHDTRDPQSVANNIVWSIYADRYGNVWVGTDHGISLLRHSSYQEFTPLDKITGTGEGNCLHAILRQSDGTMWMGGTNGLLRFRNDGKQSSTAASVDWFRQNNAAHPLAHNRVRKIYEDRTGNILVCTDHGINIYDRTSGQMRNIIVYAPNGHYSTAWAYDIVEDNHGRYWISSYLGGVFIVSKSKMLAANGKLNADRHLSKELQNIHVGQLAADKKGNIWALLYGDGLDCIDANTLQVSHVVKGKQVTYLLPDHQGNIWVGGDGIARCYDSSRKVVRDHVLTSGSDRRVITMTEAQGCLWVMTEGRCNVFKDNGESDCYSLQGFRPFASWSNGDVVFLGGNDGFVTISLADNATKHDISKGKLLLTGLTVNGKAYIPKGESVMWSDYITLKSSENNLSLEFSDIPFSGTPQTVYAYQLDGVDHTWQYLDNGQMTINYNGLPHGKYHLSICRIDGTGKPGAEIYGMDIRIMPPWYLSVWAKLAYLCIVIGFSVWALNFYNMKKRLVEEHKAKEEIMQQTAQRTAFFKNLSTQIRKPLTSIMAGIYRMMPNETDIQRQQQLDNVRRDTTQLNLLVHKALDIFDSNNGEAPQTNDLSSADIVDFCRYIATDMKKESESANVGIDFRTDLPHHNVKADIVKLQIAMFSLLRYFTYNSPQDSRIQIRISQESGDATVTTEVSNPSMHIAEDKRPFLFHRYTADSNEGSQNGLWMVKEYADAHSVALGVDADNGTSISLTFQTERKARQQHTSQGIATKAQAAASYENADSKLLAEINATIEKHLADSDFNVTRLQESVGIGSKLLYRRLKQLTDKTPVEYIRHVRMQRAALLLRDGRFTVSEVMYMVGFSNSSYFSKCFSKEYGITPAEYARKTVS